MFGGFTYGGPPASSLSPGSAAVTAANTAMGMLVGPQGNVTSIAKGDGGSGNAPAAPATDGGHYAQLMQTPQNLSQDGSLGDFGAHLGIVPMVFQLGKFLLGPLMDGTAPPLPPYAPPPAPPSGLLAGVSEASQGYPGGGEATYSGYTAPLAPGEGEPLNTGLPQTPTGLPQNVTQPGISVV